MEGDKTKQQNWEKKGEKVIAALILNTPNGAKAWQSACQMEFLGANGV